MSTHVNLDVTDGVATITMSDPDTRNALSAEMVNGLGDALAHADADPGVRVTVLTNDGPVFCAGADLKGSSREEPRFTLPEILDLIQLSGTPVVGRIAGHCTGGGVGLAAACDISVVSEDVVLGFTEVRIGVVPAMISVVCLPKMRHADAMELFLSGERIPAARAVEVGLLNRVVPAASLDGAVEEVVARLRRGGPQALAVAKSLVRTVPTMDRQAAWTWTQQVSLERFGSAEAAEGMAAFREKRQPSWATDA